MEKRQLIFGEVRKAPEADSRVVTFVASDSSKDGHGTVLPVDKWDLERFNNNGVIGYQHNLHWSTDPDNVLGTGRAYIENGELLVDIEFEPADLNALAEKIYRKVMRGTLKAVSVGFIGDGHMGVERSGEDINTYYFDAMELIEVSVVNIPSNKNALKKALADYRSMLVSIGALEEGEERGEQSAEVVEVAEEVREEQTAEVVEEDNTRAQDLERAKEIREKIIMAEAKALLLINNY